MLPGLSAGEHRSHLEPWGLGPKWQRRCWGYSESMSEFLGPNTASPRQVAPRVVIGGNEEARNWSLWQRQGSLAQLHSMPGAVWLRLDELVERGRVDRAPYARGTHAGQWWEFHVCGHSEPAYGDHGPEIQSRHKRMHDGVSRLVLFGP